MSERAVRRVKEGTSAVLLQSGLDEEWWADSLEFTAICAMFKTSWQTGKQRVKGDLENHFMDQ